MIIILRLGVHQCAGEITVYTVLVSYYTVSSCRTGPFAFINIVKMVTEGGGPNYSLNTSVTRVVPTAGTLYYRS